MSEDTITVEQFAEIKGMSTIGLLAFLRLSGLEPGTGATIAEFERILASVRNRNTHG